MITLLPSPYPTLVVTLGFTLYPLKTFDFKVFFFCCCCCCFLLLFFVVVVVLFLDKVSAQGYTIHFKRPKLIFLDISL